MLVPLGIILLLAGSPAPASAQGATVDHAALSEGIGLDLDDPEDDPEADALGDFITRLDVLARRIAAREDVHIVFHARGVILAPPHLDLTAAVAAEFPEDAPPRDRSSLRGQRALTVAVIDTVRLAETEEHPRQELASARRSYGTTMTAIDEEMAKLRRERDVLEKQRPVLKPDTYEKQAKANYRRLLAQAVKGVDAAKLLWQEERSAAGKLDDESLLAGARTLAAREGATIVLDARRAEIVFAEEGHDLTGELVRIRRAGRYGTRGPIQPSKDAAKLAPGVGVVNVDRLRDTLPEGKNVVAAGPRSAARFFRALQPRLAAAARARGIGVIATTRSSAILLSTQAVDVTDDVISATVTTSAAPVAVVDLQRVLDETIDGRATREALALASRNAHVLAHAEKERAEVGRIVAKAQGLLAGVAKRDRTGLVFERVQSGVVYAHPTFDVTPEIVDAYDTGRSLTAVPAARAGLRLAVVDIDRAMQAVPDGKEGRSRIEAEFARLKPELDANVPGFEKREAEATLDAFVKNETDAVRANLESVVAGVARQDGITLVLDLTEGGVWYADPAIDLTARVIAAGTAWKLPGKAPTAAPPQKVGYVEVGALVKALEAGRQVDLADPGSVARFRAAIHARLATVAKARGLAVITTEDTDLRIAESAVNVTDDVAKAK